MTETVGMGVGFLTDRSYDNTPVGRPCEGIGLYLLNEQGERSDEGEICLSGHLGRGYLNLPEQTAATFTPNPFKDEDGYDTLIRTGDLGRLLPDGNLIYVNRKDWMIKLNGQRVEPGEIEAAIRALDGIADAVVKDFVDPAGQIFLAAYYLSDGERDEEALKRALAETLPDYMVPARFVHLERFPVNANGKLDRKALRAPDLSRSRAAYAAPENDRQAKTAAAFEAVLGAETVGIDDDFFSLGGDSIKVIMLQKALHEAGIDVSSQTVFEARTPRALAAAAAQESPLSAYKGSRAAAYPLTRAQMSIYLDCRQEGKGTSYNNVLGLFLPADMGAGASKLQTAVESVLNRYPILTAVVKEAAGMPALAPTGKKIAAEIVWTEACDRDALARRVNTPFDLENDVPCRAVIFDTPEGLFLVLALHHIVCDGTTASILVKNIAAAFNGEELAPEGMSNLTLAQYESEHAAGLDADAAVYREMLDAVEGDTALYPDDDPALKQAAGKPGLYRTTLFAHQAELSGRLTAALSAHRITEASLFLSAYAYLLRLFCNQKNVTFFVGENGRHDPVLRNTVGMLVHNVPVCVNAGDDQDCAAFMEAVQARFHNLVAHDGADFAALIGEYNLRPECFFVYQGEMLSGATLGGRFIPLEFYRSDDVMAPMTLHVFKQPGGDYALHFEYAAELFAADTVARMAAVYARIVAGLCSCEKLKDIPLAGDGELAEMDGFNATEKDYPVTDIVSLFRARAAKHPDNPAVIFRDETLTYAQADGMSERIAGFLRSRGIGRGGVVSILIPRNSYMVTASLGVLKSGAAYQPLDPTYPADRLAFMMRDAGTKLLIADEALLEKVPEYDGPVLLTQDIPNLPTCAPARENPRPEDLFILLYTSGSTGTPKGVMLEHRNLANFCAWYREFYRLDENSRVAAYASYGFDANMMDLYPALTTGACVVIIEEEIRLDLLALEKRFNEKGITHSFMTTQVGRQFYTMADVKSMRYLSTGGEKLVPLPPREGGPAFFNVYGPTECTIFTTAMRMERLYERVPIGKPLANYKVYVIDEYGRRLPPLIPGELLVAGRGVARGYLNRPDLTEKAFISNPFDRGEDYARAYRSGDVVRALPDGNIDFIGRNDGQVKVRGFRVELTEVEGVIRDFPGITDATVQAFEDEGSGEKFIAAYVVSGGDVDVTALNAFILERKPPYMVPAVTMQIDAIPLNQNQKVNKKALPRPRRQKAETVPPRNEAQQKIFDCIAEVVGHTDFGITTNIFEAGLSSIGAIRLNVLLSRAFDTTVSTRDLRTQDTVEKLEAFILTRGEEDFELLEEYPVTKTQEGIFVETQSHPDTTIYNIPTLIALDGSIDPERLKAAVAAAIEAHPYIKTRFFLNEKGELRQKRMDAERFTGAGVAEIACDGIDAVRDKLVKPFDLLTDRLFRVSLLRTPEKLYLFLDVHHIVNDGVSQEILMKDISRAYAGETLEKEKYSGYEAALLEARMRESDHYRRAKDYYTALLGDCEPDCLPLGDAEADCGGSGTVYVQGAADARAIETYCARNGLSLNAFYTAAFGYAVAKFCGREDAVFTTVNSGRNDPRFAESVCMFVKTYPVLCKTWNRPIRDYIASVSEQLVDSLTYDVYSFEEISRELGVSADLIFAWQGAVTGGDDTFCGAKCERIPLELDEAKAAIEFTIYPHGGENDYHCAFRTSLYTEEFIRGFLRVYDCILTSFTRREKLSDVELVDAQTAAEMDGFNATERAYEITDIVTLFRRQAKANPDRSAVLYKDKVFSYREVDEISDRIAGYLRRRGVGKGSVVSVMIPRSTYMVTASLGVLKSGAAYQPLDPTYPPERLDFMMRDAGVKLLIADAELLSRVPEYRGEVLLLKDIPALPPCEPVREAPAPEDLFILLYTSGSTGTPKGVEILHRNLANFVSWYREFYDLDETCRVAAYASYGFDADMMDLYPALTTGACVCIIEEDIRLDLLALEAYLNRNAVTHVFMTTQVGRQFYTMADVKSMRYLSTGGEKLVPLPPVEGAAPFFNLYGPTECTIVTTAKRVDRLYERVPIGKPLANYKVYVIDEYGRRMPPLVPGELLIAGAGVARGYLNRPDLTEKAFIRNPFADEAGYERAYRSGDVVRLLPNGDVDFIGRNDGQIKVRGFRIELTEVEGIIREFPGITDATVQAFEDEGTGEKYIAAYVVSDEAVDIQALHAFIRAEKPPYMVPSVTMQLPAIPLNQNQKVDKKSLPKPERQKVDLVPPQNETQQTIFDCVSEVVGHKDFGVTTDIFEAGVSSIGAIRLNVLLSRAFDIPVTTRDLKDCGTVEKLEAFVNANKGGESRGTFEVQADYPLSKTQEGVYVECVSRPGTTTYNIPILLRLDDSLDEEKLKAALVAAVNAHPFIKTRLFLNDDGEARMRRMDADMSFDAEAIECIEGESLDAVRDRIVRPFNLIGGRLFRIALIHAGGLYLLIEMHHLVSDGTSMQLFLRDISDAYAGKDVKTETFTGYEVVLNEAHLRTAEKLEETKQYYAALLSDAETASLPAGDLKEKSEAVSGLYEAEGAYATAGEVRAFCEKNGLSMNAFFSAAFGAVLNACLGTESAVFAGIYNGRSDSRLADTVAMLVKTIPIVSAPKASETVVEHVRALGRQLGDTQARDLYSFAEICRKFHVNADVMFAYQGDEFSFDSLCGAPAKMLNVDLGTVKAPLNVNLYLKDDAIRYNFEYRADRYSAGRIRAMADALDKAVQEMLTRGRMSEISFVTELTAAELNRFNDTAAAVDTAFAPQRMARAAREYGEHTAVIARSGTVSLSFAELNRRANKIAHALKRGGLGRGRRAGLYLERTEDVYAVREGIMKSGAAFVSLEPDYPDERIEFILADAGIDTLLTTLELFRERQKLFQRKGLDVIFVESIYISDASEDDPDLSELCGDDPAYCIYTSGSTGNPKGVEITHGNLRNLLDYNDKNTLAHAYVDHSTVWLALAAITFDVSVIEEMMPLYHGKTVCIATSDEIHNPMLLLRTMKKNGVDMMKCTPSYMLSILEVPDSGDVFRRLRAVILGAEPFPAGLYQKMRDAGFTGIIFNSYGPTETCVSVSVGTLDGERVTIGGPTANTRFYIRDRFGNVLPAWMRGELVIAGEQVGNGYIGLPEKTKAVFIRVDDEGRTAPEGAVPAYRSGDVAYWNDRGEIMHCGRNDNQVKLRGLRIELDGIENVMNGFPTIERSVVRVLGEGDGKYLCGYYVAPHPVDEEALSAHLRKTLTAYMVPGVYVHLEKLPLTVNGKIDKKALPMPAAPEKRGGAKEPATELQKTIAAMFARALGVERVGVDEDFFEIGGTSMLASKVAMSAMVQELPIAYQDVFANPTVEKLEAHVLKMQGAAAEHEETAGPAPEETADGIKGVLSKNTMANIDGIAPGELGNVLLTGATGFLGVHVLRQLLEHGTGKILCLIRKGRSGSAEKRLKAMLVYYFDQSYDELFENGRLTVVDGDITDRDAVLAQSGALFDTVINCAACVKHFAADDILERVNVTGVRNLIELCEKTGTRLIQISTVSVAGEDVNNALPAHTVMYENMLYFGQDLSNQYVHSKFAAEQAVLNAVAEGKLDAKIIRVGNLMSRSSDGEFQANAVTSGFMRNLRGYATIGAFPVEGMAAPVEFSPIDCVAEAVCLLAGTPAQYTVFHAVNGHWIEMGDLIAAMNAAGLPVEITDRRTFERRLKEALADEKKNMMVSGLISYLSSDTDSVRRYVPEDHTFTKNALYRLGFRWPLTDEDYLRNAIRALETFGFFDRNDL